MATEVEIWESTIPGRISMSVPGPRDTLKPVTVFGKGARLRIEPAHRELVEESIRQAQNNPFINGKLFQVGGPKRVPPSEGDEELTGQQMTDDDLSSFFSLDADDFTAALKELSEANVRRLHALFRDKGGTVLQQEIIRDYIEETWPITSGDTPSYREMRQEPVR